MRLKPAEQGTGLVLGLRMASGVGRRAHPGPEHTAGRLVAEIDRPIAQQPLLVRDSGTANSWAEPQVDRVQVSAQTVPMGLFSLSAPALPAAKPVARAPPRAMPDAAAARRERHDQFVLPGQQNPHRRGVRRAVRGHCERRFRHLVGLGRFRLRRTPLLDRFERCHSRRRPAEIRSPAQAHAAALLEYGGNAANNRVCTDAAVPDSLCLAAPVSASDLLQKETVRVLAWKGDYEVSVSVSISNSADLTQAYTWAQQQLDMLSATSSNGEPASAPYVRPVRSVESATSFRFPPSRAT